MSDQSRVCVEFDEIVDRFNWTTVVVKGRYEELTKSPAHEAARKRAYLLFETRPDWRDPAAGETRSSDVRTPVIYRIQNRRPERPPGRSRSGEGRPGQARSGLEEGAALVESRAAPAAGPAAGFQIVPSFVSLQTFTDGGNARTSVAVEAESTRYATDPPCGPRSADACSPITMRPASRSLATFEISSAESP